MNLLEHIFKRKKSKTVSTSLPVTMKFLVAGLGNIGVEYQNTRHNIGFKLADAFVADLGGTFESQRYGSVAEMRYRGHQFIVLKPSTYMNLSGKAVHYWLQKEKITVDHLLVLVDDIALPMGTIRMRPKGSDGGHNGLKDICAMIGTDAYARIRFGVGNDFARGGQVDYVLGTWSDEEEKIIAEKQKQVVEMIKNFSLEGVERTMNKFNTKHES